MATVPVLVQIPNLGTATTPVSTASDLLVIAQSGIARKITVADFVASGATGFALLTTNTFSGAQTIQSTLAVTGNVSIGSANTEVNLGLTIAGPAGTQRQISFYTGSFTRGRISLDTSDQMQFSMTDAAGANRREWIDFTYNSATSGSPDVMRIGASYSSSQYINTTAAGDIKARSFTTFSTNQVMSGTTPINQVANFNAIASGTTTLTGALGFFNFNFSADTVQGTAALTTMVIGNTPGTNATGGRAGLFVATTRNSAISSLLADTSDGNTAITAHLTIAANLGGVASGYGTFANLGSGNGFSYSSYTSAVSGGTYLRTLTAGENDFEVDSTSSCISLLGRLYAHAGAHEFQPSFRHTVFAIQDQAIPTSGGDALYGWKNVILVGGAQWPMSPTSVAIQLEVGAGTSPVPAKMSGMIDTLHGAFTGTAPGGGPYFARWPGGIIVPSTSTDSYIQLGFAKLKSTSTGASLDINQSQLTAISVNNGGTDWSLVYGQDTLGNVVKVTAVSAGVVTAATIYRGGWYDSATAPATSTFTGVGGGGLGVGGLILNLTWTPQNILDLQVSGGLTRIGGSATVTGYVNESVGNALTAAGTTRADALQLAKQYNRLTTAAASTGVILPTGVVGMCIVLFNAGANAVKVYANGSETIDGTAGNTGVTLTNALRCAYYFVAANTWVSAQLGAVSA